ncbi:hypothetical protein [Kingella denitrificans]|nr:hypothetical protein [Kingella denitrificans]
MNKDCRVSAVFMALRRHTHALGLPPVAKAACTLGWIFERAGCLLATTAN